MGKFLAALHHNTSKLHREIGEMTFLKRYNTEEMRLIDHYRHLTQLKPLYEVLEEKLKNLPIYDDLKTRFPHLLNRSEEIRKDINFLASKISDKNKNVVLESTNDYVNKLKKCEDDNTILSHFLVRILGDLFGGQSIKRYVLNLYARTNCATQNNLGVAFFGFEPNTLKDLLKYLDDAVECDLSIIDPAKDAFLMHRHIFNELEDTRLSKSWYLVPNFSSLFTARNLLIAGAVAAAAVAAAELEFLPDVLSP